MQILNECWRLSRLLLLLFVMPNVFFHVDNKQWHWWVSKKIEGGKAVGVMGLYRRLHRLKLSGVTGLCSPSSRIEEMPLQ